MSQPAENHHKDGDRTGLREGEIAVELPAKLDAQLYFIGRIRTPWKIRDECPKNGRETEEVCTIELEPRWAAGLQGLETVSRVLVLYWMDKARRDLVLQSPRHYAERRGTFALRSPVRPNPIAAAVTRLQRIEGNKLFVIGLDCMDGTPLLDLKPYFASTEFRARRLGRLARRAQALTCGTPSPEGRGWGEGRVRNLNSTVRTPSSCPSPLWGEGTQRFSLSIAFGLDRPTDRWVFKTAPAPRRAASVGWHASCKR